jgi:hypothetical protein
MNFVRPPNDRPASLVRRWPRLAKAVLSFVVLTVGVLPCSASQAQHLSEVQLRARFLLNFLRFTEWPEGAYSTSTSALHLCVLGSGDPLEGALAEIQGTSVGGRKVSVQDHVAADQASDCHLLYVPDSELARIPSARESIGKRAVLIVGESEAVLDRGGMIALRTVDRHLAFVVKLGTARRADLEFSPQMLRAAAEVLP